MVICLLVLGGISLILFVVIEWRVAKLPMMPVDIYKNPAVSAMLVQNFLMGASYQAVIYFVPLYLQNAHQFSIIQSALIWIPLVGLQSGISILSGLYISKFKRYGECLWFGFGIWTLGSGLCLLLTRKSPIGIIIIPLIVIGIGVGCIFQPILVALQAHSPKARRAVIISNRNFCRCAGGACGLAVSAAVMQASLRASLPAEYANLAGSTFTLPEFDGDIPAAVLDAYMAASHSVFILQVPLIGLCFLGNFFIRDRGLELPDEKSPVQEQEPGQIGGEQGIRMELAESDTNAEAGVKGTSRSK
uniref:Major facilitator superfamily (MFS) profile domain-containing protein n=1 Tax=Bionectria ochroleuca TaxID=29856 RepID=A0A8H7K6P8_BIOOC